MYSLGAIFGVVAVASFVLFGNFLINLFSERKVAQLSDWVVPVIGIFCSGLHLSLCYPYILPVRSAFFFVVAQNISGIVLDFLLAVLPTFIYFTAFTLIIGLW
jgi:hypothetical protein